MTHTASSSLPYQAASLLALAPSASQGEGGSMPPTQLVVELLFEEVTGNVIEGPTVTTLRRGESMREAWLRFKRKNQHSIIYPISGDIEGFTAMHGWQAQKLKLMPTRKEPKRRIQVRHVMLVLPTDLECYYQRLERASNWVKWEPEQ